MILAYRIQEREYGGLSHSAGARLCEIVKRYPRNGHVPKSLKLTSKRTVHGSLESGTGKLMRSSVLTILIYRGQYFASLSKIAREIIGTQWSGPAFFGTKNNKEKKAR